MCAEAGETYRAAKCSSSFLMFFAIGSSTGGSTSGWAQACVVMRATRVLCLNNARQAINFTTAPTTARSAPRRFRIYVYIYIIGRSCCKAYSSDSAAQVSNACVHTRHMNPNEQYVYAYICRCRSSCKAYLSVFLSVCLGRHALNT